MKVNNVSEHYGNYKYVVVRDCKEEVKSFYHGDTTKRYWYYGAYNDLRTAQLACDECGNGFVVESSEVEPLTYGGW